MRVRVLSNFGDGHLDSVEVPGPCTVAALIQSMDLGRFYLNEYTRPHLAQYIYVRLNCEHVGFDAWIDQEDSRVSFSPGWVHGSGPLSHMLFSFSAVCADYKGKGLLENLLIDSSGNASIYTGREQHSREPHSWLRWKHYQDLYTIPDHVLPHVDKIPENAWVYPARDVFEVCWPRNSQD